ncbi:hypothetical protein FRB98_007289 [Tulasnella sp. 332]|nr:hypothetical protein FRB98_007289 [Tulasnella sp. 332]
MPKAFGASLVPVSLSPAWGIKVAEQQPSRPGAALTSLVEDLGAISPLRATVNTDRPPTPPPKPVLSAMCGICQERFYKTSDPLLATRSNLLPADFAIYGLTLPCPGQHNYCLACMNSYIRAKVDPDNETGRREQLSIRCPECPREEGWRMEDDTAVKLLDGDLLEAYYFQKLLSSLQYASGAFES